MLEYFTVGGFRLLLDIVRSGWRFWRRNKRVLTQNEILKARLGWKPKFEAYVWKTQRDKLRQDAIMRDFRRMDSYPSVDDRGKGISPWFRFGLVGTYEKGFMAAIRYGELIEDPDTGKVRYVDYAGKEKGVGYALVGFVPYERVENVDWEGDQFYDYPHIYCHFDGKGRVPYERLAYCSPFTLNDRTYFRETYSLAEVDKESKRKGLRHF